MSKYDALGQYLREQLNRGTDVVEMTFEKIEEVIGFKLPASQRFPAWWSNNPSNNTMTKVWLDAGFSTKQVDVVGKKVVFWHVDFGSGLVEYLESSGGMAEDAPAFKHAESKQPRRHPAFGALKGTFTIEPGYDLTTPSMDADELAEMDANLNRTADLIEAGMKRKPQ